MSLSVGFGFTEADHDTFHDQFVHRDNNVSATARPHTLVLSPVFSELGNKESRIAGILAGQLAFDVYLLDLLPDTVKGIHAVFNNSCGEAHTYELTGNRASYLGFGDLHDPKHNGRAVPFDFSDYEYTEQAKLLPGHCYYTMILYPTDAFADQYESTAPVVFTCVVAGTFALMILIFFGYDRIVDRRNDKVVDAAARSSAIVSSLFPSNVRDRLYAEAEGRRLGSYTRLKSFLNEGGAAVSGDDAEEVLDDGIAV